MKVFHDKNFLEVTIPVFSSFCKWLYNRRPVGVNQRNKFIHALKIISELLHASSPTIPIRDNYCNSCVTGNPMSLQTKLQLSAQFSEERKKYSMKSDSLLQFDMWFQLKVDCFYHSLHGEYNYS